MAVPLISGPGAISTTVLLQSKAAGSVRSRSTMASMIALPVINWTSAAPALPSRRAPLRRMGNAAASKPALKARTLDSTPTPPRRPGNLEALASLDANAAAEAAPARLLARWAGDRSVWYELLSLSACDE